MNRQCSYPSYLSKKMKMTDEKQKHYQTGAKQTLIGTSEGRILESVTLA